jgi:transcriptional regulator with XRE-family HTH domain
MDVELGRKLKASRIEAGFDSPVDIGLAVGRSKRQVANYERGCVPPSDVLQKWATATGKSLEYFLPSPPVAPDSVPAPQQHPGVERLTLILQAAPGEAVSPEELDDLCGSTWDHPIATAGEALDILLARRRARCG